MVVDRFQATQPRTEIETNESRANLHLNKDRWWSSAVWWALRPCAHVGTLRQWGFLPWKWRIWGWFSFAPERKEKALFSWGQALGLGGECGRSVFFLCGVNTIAWTPRGLRIIICSLCSASCLRSEGPRDSDDCGPRAYLFKASMVFFLWAAHFLVLFPLSGIFAPSPAPPSHCAW